MAKISVEDIVKQWLEAGLTVSSVELVEGHLGYNLDGFGKSGCGLLLPSPKDGTLLLKTRYGQEDEVSSLKDVITVAYDWNDRSEHLGFRMDPTVSELYHSLTGH